MLSRGEASDLTARSLKTKVLSLTAEQQGEVEGDQFERVLVGSLGAVEVFILVRVHGRVLDPVLLAQLPNAAHLPEVE